MAKLFEVARIARNSDTSNPLHNLIVSELVGRERAEEAKRVAAKEAKRKKQQRSK